MCSPIAGVVKSIWRYCLRLSSVDFTPIDANRFAIVPVDSSAARIPFAGATSVRAVSVKALMDPLFGSRREAQAYGAIAPDDRRFSLAWWGYASAGGVWGLRRTGGVVAAEERRLLDG